MDCEICELSKILKGQLYCMWNESTLTSLKETGLKLQAYKRYFCNLNHKRKGTNIALCFLQKER